MKTKTLLRFTLLFLLLMTFPLFGKERVICEVEVLSENSARIKLKWNDENKSTPIRMIGWTFLENQGLKVLYEVNANSERGWDERRIEGEGLTFPMKIFLEESGKERTSFDDLPKSEEMRLSIFNLYDRGILSGYSEDSFKPGKNVSRAEFAKMVFETAAYDPLHTDQISFRDVDNSFWGKSYILNLAQRGILKGRQEGIFDPNGSITLGEVLAVIDRTFLFYDQSDTYTGQLKQHWSNENFLSLASAGIIKKSDSFYQSYSPNEQATRQQCALLLSRVLETLSTARSN